MNGKFSGGCKCGAVRYEISAEPLASAICRCLDCQKLSGSGHTADMVFPKDALSPTGETNTYQYTGGSGNPVESVFCPHCGTPLFGRPFGGKIIVLRISSLDDRSAFTPEMVIFNGKAQSWDQTDSALPHYPGAPGAQGK